MASCATPVVRVLCYHSIERLKPRKAQTTKKIMMRRRTKPQLDDANARKE